jgi:hypothetical protein
VLHALASWLPEMAKKPTDPFVSVYVQGMMFPEAFRVDNTPITVPGGAVLLTFRLLIVIVIRLSTMAN